MHWGRRWSRVLLALLLALSSSLSHVQAAGIATRVAYGAQEQGAEATPSGDLAAQVPNDAAQDDDGSRPPEAGQRDVPATEDPMQEDDPREVVGSYVLEPNGPEAATQERPLFADAQTAVVPECPFEWERHAFVGWNTQPDGGGQGYAMGEDMPADSGVTLYAQWEKTMPEGVESLDFSSCRLIVGMDARPSQGEVLSEHEGVYLLGFEDKSDTAWAYKDLLQEAQLVAPDLTFEVASRSLGGTLGGDALAPTLVEQIDGRDSAELPSFVPRGDGDVAGPAADLSSIGEAKPVEPGVVALVDTGVSARGGNVVSLTSVIGDVVVDDNGHGTAMFDAMREVDPKVRVASIKALDSWGTGSAASVYAAVKSAIEMRAKVVNLSLSAPAVAGNAAVEQAIRDAHDAGIMVVGAAGNDDKDARWFVPGRMGDEAVIVGSCDAKGARSVGSNFGESVDVWVPSASTSYAAAKASAWLAAHGTFGGEVEQLLSEEARLALGTRTDVAAGADDGAPAEEAGVGAAFTHPSMKVRAYWHRSIGSFWGATYTSSISGPANTGQEGRNYDLYVLNFNLTNGSESGGLKYRGYYNGTWNSYVTSGNVGVMSSKLVQAQFQFTGDLAKHYVWGHSWHKYETDDSTGGDSENGSVVTCNSGGLAIDGLGVWIKKQSWPQVIMVRYQNADGSWGQYAKAKSDVKEYQDTYGWSRAADATYKAASISYTVTGAETKYVSVERRASNNVIQARYQNADGSWGAYSDVVNAQFGIGETVSWSSPESDTFQAASCSFVAGETGRTEQVSVRRKSAVATVRYRLQNVDGSYPDEYAVGGSATKCVGGSYTFTYQQTNTHQEASGTATIAPAASATGTPQDVTVDIDVPRRTCELRIDCLDPWGNETSAPDAVHAAYFDLSLDDGATWEDELYDEPDPAPNPKRGQVVRIRNVWVRPGFKLADVRGATRQSDGTYAITMMEDTTITITTACKPFSVAFDANGGPAEGTREYTQDYATSVTAPQVARKGYGFAGWVPVKADDPQWVEVLFQSPMAAAFGDEAGALGKNELDAYSALGQLEQLRSGGTWEFLLGAEGLEGTNRWRQGSDPVRAPAASGYQPVSLAWNAADFGGLVRRADGSLAAWSAAPGGWWYAIGAFQRGRVPLAQDLDLWTRDPIHLYVRSDDTLSSVGASYDSGYQQGASIPVRAQDQLFKAKWQPNKLTISYDPNGGTFASLVEPTVATWEDGSIVLPSVPNAVRDGYEPQPRWHVGAPDGPVVPADSPMGARDLADLAGVDLGASDQAVTLYLDWRLMRYTIEFDANCDPSDVTGETPSLEAWRDKDVTLPTCGYVRELFDFVSWNTKPDGSGDWLGAQTTVRNLPEEGVPSMVLYAMWAPKQVRVIIPTALHYVASQDGALGGPDDDVARVINASQIAVEICGIRAESYAPWQVVPEHEVERPQEYAMGMSLGARPRLDFARLDGSEGRFGCLGLDEGVGLKGLFGEVGQAPMEECEVGCLHWRVRGIRTADRYD